RSPATFRGYGNLGPLPRAYPSSSPCPYCVATEGGPDDEVGRCGERSALTWTTFSAARPHQAADRGAAPRRSTEMEMIVASVTSPVSSCLVAGHDCLRRPRLAPPPQVVPGVGWHGQMS